MKRNTVIIAAAAAVILAVGAFYLTRKEKTHRITLEEDYPTHHAPGMPEGEAYKAISERPPKTEAEYRKIHKEAPRRLLYCTTDNRYYTYVSGKRMFFHPPTNIWYPGTPAD